MIQLGRIFLLLIVISLIGCNTSETNDGVNNNIKNINIIDYDSKTKWSFSDFFEIVDLIQLNTTENNLIAEAQKMYYIDDKFFIFDRRFSIVKVFDRNGKYLFDIGKIGQADGEYTHLDDIDYNLKDNTFSFFSNSERSVFTYSIEGKYLGKFKVDFFAFGLVNVSRDSTFFNINFNLSDESKNNNLLLTNDKGKVLNRYFLYQAGYDVPSSTSSGFLNKNNEGILYSTAYDDTFYQFSNGKWKAKYKFDLNELKVPLIKIRNMDEFRKNIMDYSHLTERCSEDENVLHFSYIHKKIYKKGFFLKKSNQVVTGYNFSNESMYNISSPPDIIKSGFYLSTLDNEGFFYHKLNNPSLIDSLSQGNTKYKNILNNHKDSDNPIIIMYRLKSNKKS